MIQALPKGHFTKEEHQVVSEMLDDFHAQGHISNQKKIIESIHEMKVRSVFYHV